MKSVLQKNKECYLCGTTWNLEKHHVIFGNGNRDKSEKYGLTVWLCPNHHRGNFSPHHNRRLDLNLKEIAQEKWESQFGTREQFLIEFGRSYL